MKDVRDLRSDRVAIYSPNAVPLNRIIAGGLGPTVQERFAFKNVAAEGGGVQLNFGRLAIDHDEVIVLAIQFDNRRIIVNVEGTSEQADGVAAVLESIVFEEENTPSAAVVAYSSVCTAVLDFGWQALYSKGLIDFLGEHLKSSATAACVEPRIAGSALAINLAYEIPLGLAEQSIALDPKVFTFAPAPQTPLAEHRFMAGSPTRSEEHLRLLEQLEAALAPKVR